MMRFIALVLLSGLLGTLPAMAQGDNPCNPCGADNPCSADQPADNPCGPADEVEAPAGPVYDSAVPINEQFAQMRLAFMASLPEDSQAFFAGQQQLLHEKDIPALALQLGEQAPDLIMAQPGEEPLAFSDFVADGPVILQFYRGNW